MRNRLYIFLFDFYNYIKGVEKLSFRGVIIFAIIIILIFSYVRIKHLKGRIHNLKVWQQKTDEEIYELLLKQQLKFEEGSLKERQRISEELHDGVLARIYGTRINLEFLSAKEKYKNNNAHNFIIRELQNIEKEIRTISHKLKNELFSADINFIAIVKKLIETQSDIGLFKYIFSNDKKINWMSINENIKFNCYRIIQEAFQNIIKHSNATYVSIEFKLIECALEIFIKDNGNGFDINNDRNGIGLKNIQSRTKRIGGKFKINSSINFGTVLIVLIPL